MNFMPLENTDKVEAFCLVKNIEKRKTAKGLPYLDLILTDNSGDIEAKFWDYTEQTPEIAPNDFIKVRGTLTEYRGTQQLRVERIRHVTPKDDVRVEDFVPSTREDAAKLYEEVYALTETFKDEDYKKLVQAILAQQKEALLYMPAAYRLHHAIRGGLLMHILTIARLAQAVVKIYPYVNEALLLSGVILHDIGKIKEFEVSATGLVTNYTVDGTLVGHIVRGTMYVHQVAESLGIPKEKTMLLEHLILSHHGEPEFGAAVRPSTIEAEVLSQLDLFDARMYEMAEAVSQTQQGEFTQRLWALDNRKFYHPKEEESMGEESVSPIADLF